MTTEPLPNITEIYRRRRRVLAEGCRNCNPAVDPSGDSEGDHHISIRFGQGYRRIILVNGQDGHLIHEAWLGTPWGKSIEYPPSGRASVHKVRLLHLR